MAAAIQRPRKEILVSTNGNRDRQQGNDGLVSNPVLGEVGGVWGGRGGCTFEALVNALFARLRISHVDQARPQDERGSHENSGRGGGGLGGEGAAAGRPLPPQNGENGRPPSGGGRRPPPPPSERGKW